MLNALFKFTKLPRSLGSDVSIGLLFNLKSVGPTLDLASRHFLVPTKKQRFCRTSHKRSVLPRQGRLLRSALERNGMSNNTKQVPSTTFSGRRWKQYVPRNVGTHPDDYAVSYQMTTPTPHLGI